MSGTRAGAIKGWQTRRREGHARPAKQPDKVALQAQREKAHRRMMATHAAANDYAGKHTIYLGTPEYGKLARAATRAQNDYFKAAHKEEGASLKLSIRKHTYNGVEGYLLYGGGRGSYGTKIFTRTREEAEQARERLKRGEEPFPASKKTRRR